MYTFIESEKVGLHSVFNFHMRDWPGSFSHQIAVPSGNGIVADGLLNRNIEGIRWASHLRLFL
jgi:hypothetical protein